jgi:hypothetical protein
VLASFQPWSGPEENLISVPYSYRSVLTVGDADRRGDVAPPTCP